jgi:hypothetical protein
MHEWQAKVEDRLVPRTHGYLFGVADLDARSAAAPDVRYHKRERPYYDGRDLNLMMYCLEATIVEDLFNMHVRLLQGVVNVMRHIWFGKACEFLLMLVVFSSV